MVNISAIQVWEMMESDELLAEISMSKSKSQSDEDIAEKEMISMSMLMST